MKFPAISFHVELEFDSTSTEPNPWWRPFIWWKLCRDEMGYWQRVLRLGALGFHFCLSLAFFPKLA